MDTNEHEYKHQPQIDADSRRFDDCLDVVRPRTQVDACALPESGKVIPNARPTRKLSVSICGSIAFSVICVNSCPFAVGL